MKKYHLLKAIYYYSDNGFDFEIRDAVSLPRGAFWHLLGPSGNFRTQWGCLQLVESCWPLPLNYIKIVEICEAYLDFTLTHIEALRSSTQLQFWLLHRPSHGCEWNSDLAFRSAALPQTQSFASQYADWAYFYSLWTMIRILRREGPSSGRETDELEPAGWIHSSDHLDFRPTKPLLHSSRILSAFCKGACMKHRTGGFSSPKAFPSLCFPLPILHESSKRWDCRFQRFTTGWRESGAGRDASCLTRASCYPLCTS